VNIRKTIVAAAAAVSVLLISGGCGYRVGNIGHPELQSIAVAPVGNDTTIYNVGTQVRGILCEVFTTDGTMKLVSDSKADCILYAKVTEIAFAESANSGDNDEDDFVPDRWKVSIKLQYSVIVPGRLEPLVSNAKASGSAEFHAGADMEIGRLNGIRQAALSAAKDIVYGITERW